MWISTVLRIQALGENVSLCISQCCRTRFRHSVQHTMINTVLKSEYLNTRFDLSTKCLSSVVISRKLQTTYLNHDYHTQWWSFWSRSLSLSLKRLLRYLVRLTLNLWLSCIIYNVYIAYTNQIKFLIIFDWTWTTHTHGLENPVVSR